MTAIIGGAALIGTCLAATYEGSREYSVESRRELHRIIRRMTDTWREQPQFRSHEGGRDLSDASDALIAHLPTCNMSRERLVGCATQAPGRPFPDAATDLVIAELTGRAPEVYGSDQPPLARDFAGAVIRAAFAAAIENREYFEKLQPYLLFEIARAQGFTLGMLAQLSDKVERLPDKTARAVVDELSRRGFLSPLKTETILAIARRLPENSGDLDGLVNDLIRALDAARDLLAQAGQPGNAGAVADAAVQRIAERIALQDFDSAVSEAEAAFAGWERAESERADANLRTGLAILDAGLKAQIAGSDAKRAAATEMQRVVLTVQAAEQFDAARSRQVEYLERGRDAGLRLDLDISIELARLIVNTSESSRERVYALNHLGASLQVLGERTANLAILREAAAAFHTALGLCSRDREPIDWAMCQNNLGTVLKVAATRGDTEAAGQAADAYRLALSVYTQKGTPYDWAAAQNNLGNVLRMQGSATGDANALRQAAMSFREALKVYTQDTAPLEWAAAQNNLGNVFLVLGAYGDDGASREAASAYREAHKVYTRERVPLHWAGIHHNIGSALMAAGRRGDCEALFDAARAFQEALKERTRESAPFYWAATQANLGTVCQLLAGQGYAEMLPAAAEAFQLALLVFTPGQTPQQNADASEGLMQVRAMLESARQDGP